MLNFVAIDVETANESLSSICQIGIVQFENGEIVGTYSSLINPNESFSNINIKTHGINPADVQNAPSIKDVSPKLEQALSNQVIVCYTAFDKRAISLALPGVFDSHTWLDAAAVVRRHWKQFRSKGYGLAPIAEFLEIDNSNHHDALNDSIVAGKILVKTVIDSKKPFSWWVKKLGSGISESEHESYSSSRRLQGHGRVARSGSEVGSLSGNIIVFTGDLSIPRFEAANIAAKIGADVADSVTRKTTILVVGGRDPQYLDKGEKSGKQIKAEEIIEKGGSIRILSEAAFMALANGAPIEEIDEVNLTHQKILSESQCIYTQYIGIENAKKPSSTIDVTVQIPVSDKRAAEIIFKFKFLSFDSYINLNDKFILNEIDILDLIYAFSEGWDLVDAFNDENILKLFAMYPGSDAAILKAYGNFLIEHFNKTGFTPAIANYHDNSIAVNSVAFEENPTEPVIEKTENGILQSIFGIFKKR